MVTRPPLPHACPHVSPWHPAGARVQALCSPAPSVAQTVIGPAGLWHSAPIAQALQSPAQASEAPADFPPSLGSFPHRLRSTQPGLCSRGSGGVLSKPCGLHTGQLGAWEQLLVQRGTAPASTGLVYPTCAGAPLGSPEPAPPQPRRTETQSGHCRAPPHPAPLPTTPSASTPRLRAPPCFRPAPAAAPGGLCTAQCCEGKGTRSAMAGWPHVATPPLRSPPACSLQHPQ